MTDVIEEMFGISPERYKRIMEIVGELKIDYPYFGDFVNHIGKELEFEYSEKNYVIAKETMDRVCRNKHINVTCPKCEYVYFVKIQ